MSYRPCFSWMLLALLLTDSAWSAEVRLGISSRETYVGAAVTLQVQIDNAREYREPKMPDVDGLQIRSLGAPSRSTQISTINGRTTRRSSIIFEYSVTPERAGTFTIPPIKVSADGLERITEAIRIVATTSETGDLLFVEVTGGKESVYVGEALDLTLKIWIRPFRDAQRQITLTAQDMWRPDTDQTDWGLFSDKMDEMAQSREGLRAREVLKKDGEGIERSYYLYEIDARIYPNRPGSIDAKNVRIVLSYPTRLGSSRSSFFGNPFGSSLAITGVRPIVGEVTVQPIEVKPIPTDGRPDDYRGAVGQYQIVTEAEPRQVKVGDPVTLRIGIGGTGPMDLVRAPALAMQQDLAADFKVADEELPGFVSGEAKRFETTIRPRHDQVQQIPAIRFSYFDPDLEEFVTTESAPIQIEVEKADTLALDSIVGGRNEDDAANEPEPSSNHSELTYQNFSGSDLLVSEPSATVIPRFVWLWLWLPPLGCLAVLLVMRRSSILGLLERITSAKRRFLRDLRDAETFEQVSDSLEAFLARRFGSADTNNRRSFAIGKIRSFGQHDLAIRIERFFRECEKATSVGALSSRVTVDELKEQAESLVDEVAHLRRGRTMRRSRVSASRVTTSLLTIASLTSLACGKVSAQEFAETQLTPSQRLALLDEASQFYRQADQNPDADDARRLFTTAAGKYKLLIDSGIANSKLHFNLANALQRSEQAGRAIASYRRALRLSPTNQMYQTYLEAAQQSLANSTVDEMRSMGWWESFRLANSRWLWLVTPQAMLITAIVSWVLLWIVVALRIMQFRFYWKSTATVLFSLSLLSVISYCQPIWEYTRSDVAVLASPQVVVRGGDGENFPVVTELKRAEGVLVRSLEVRDGWVKIRTDNGQTGWIEAKHAEII